MGNNQEKDKKESLFKQVSFLINKKYSRKYFDASNIFILLQVLTNKNN